MERKTQSTIGGESVNKPPGIGFVVESVGFIQELYTWFSRKKIRSSNLIDLLSP
jgi:hypothetical protein